MNWTRLALFVPALILASSSVATAGFRPSMPVPARPTPLRPPHVPPPTVFIPSNPGFAPTRSGYSPFHRRPGCPRRFNRRALERRVEWIIRQRLGHCVRDVDVDIDDGEVEIEVESRHPQAYRLVRAVAYSIPELRGFRIDIDIDD